MTEAKFKVGDIVCKSIYPGRDHWQQVCEVLKVDNYHYTLRPIQSRTKDRDWSMTSYISGANSLRRGSWEEDQTNLYREVTLEEQKRRSDNELEAKIRQIVREELGHTFEAREQQNQSDPFD